MTAEGQKISTLSREERIKIMKEKLAKIESTLNQFETERSQKVQAWKKKTNSLIIS